jgi:hypothetical protein
MREWRYSSTFIDLGSRWRCVVSYTNLPLYPRRKSPRYPLDRKLGGPRIRSGRCGEEKNHALLGIEPGPFIPQPVVIPTELSSIPKYYYNNQIENNRLAAHVDRMGGKLSVYELSA